MTNWKERKRKKKEFNSFHYSVHLFNPGLYFLKKEGTVENQKKKKNTHIVSILLLTEGTFRCLYKDDVLNKSVCSGGGYKIVK